MDEDLADEITDLRRLNTKLGRMLDEIAAALKGKPPPGLMHEWSDLPKLASRIRIERDLLHAQVEQIMKEREKGTKKARPGR